MFWKNKEEPKETPEEVEDIEALKTTIKELEKDKKALKEDVAELKHKKKMEDEDIRHMRKIEQEKQAIEYEKKEMALERKNQEEIAKVKDEYRDKLENDLRSRGDEIRRS